MSADRRTYSTGSYQKLENGKYRLFVSGGTGLGRKRVRRTKTVQARSDREAERLLKAFQAEIDALTNKEKMTVNAMLDLFEEDRLETTSIRTQEWYRETLRRVRAALGHMDLQELRPKDVHAFYRRIADPKSAPLDGLSGGLSPTYVLHHHRALKAAMAWAYKNDLTDRNIMDKVTSPKSEPVREKRALTDEEIRRFCAGAENLGLRWKAILLLALAGDWHASAGAVRPLLGRRGLRGGNAHHSSCCAAPERSKSHWPHEKRFQHAHHLRRTGAPCAAQSLEAGSGRTTLAFLLPMGRGLGLYNVLGKYYPY